MCGIAGILNFQDEAVSHDLLLRMAEQMRSRGPDDGGVWVQSRAGLSHRRLSILDLSSAGAQPMGRDTVLALNGEVYNFQELRLELQRVGHQFHSRSDTEVVRAAYLEWGAQAIPRLNGMFALALWDHRQQCFFLARDRFGVKPLYYYAGDRHLIFASEIKAILLHPAFKPRLNLAVLDEYFTFQNILTHQSFFEGIQILPPGHTLTVFADGKRELNEYWDYPLRQPKLQLTRHEAELETARLLSQAVQRQLVSDVPVGCYLSGGIDSGSITALASQNLGRLPSFTCGFDMSSASGLEFGLDERAQAEELANLLKTEHYQVVLHAGDMEQVLPRLIEQLEDLRLGQCYPNYYVARLASKFVKVVLSGTGGDEIFAGYPWRYKTDSGPDFTASYYKSWQRLVPDTDKAKLFRSAPCLSSSKEIFRRVLRAGYSTPQSAQERLDSCLYFELKTFLHGLLIVEDKVSMTHGLETRLPFLDNDLVDFACKLPADFKLGSLDSAQRQHQDENDLLRFQKTPSRSSHGKTILRQALLQVLPSSFTRRPKQGFSAPDASWFRGESIDYIQRLLLGKQARIYEYLQPGYVRQRIEEHTRGEENHRLFIWSLLSFEWWLRTFFA